MPKYSIADIVIDIEAPSWILHRNLELFLHNGTEAESCCRILFDNNIEIPTDARCIVKTSKTLIYVYNGLYYILNRKNEGMISCVVSNYDRSDCSMYFYPEYESPSNKETRKKATDSLLECIRKFFITLLSQKHGLLIHSASIIWNGEGIIFSAPSGEGKSTHTNMWRQKYGTEILDGDVTALRITEGVPYAYGLPWCGTSGEFLNKRVPLRAIVFLQQAEENKIKKLDFQEAFIRLVSRCFMLPYDERMTGLFLDIAQEIAGITDCYLLECLPNYEAVELVKKCLEKS